MFNFLRGTKKAKPQPVFVDMHAHWLPGIDDGAKIMEESLALLKRFQDLGYKKLIASPHIMEEKYPNTEVGIQEKLKEVQLAAQKAGLSLQLEAAAEYFLDTVFFDKVTSGKELLTFGDNFLLFELGFLMANSLTEPVIFELKHRGITPVLAHPERYLFLHEKPEKLLELRDKGVLLQLNIGSLSPKRYGEQVEKTARFLIKEKAVDLLGSDCHRMSHLDLLENVRSSRSYAEVTNLPLLNNSL